MNLPGYDAWKLSCPPEDDGPTCNECGSAEDVRVEGRGKMICRECFSERFDSLPTPTEYAEDEAAERADHRREELRDRD